jgi:hypothetical protein
MVALGAYILASNYEQIGQCNEYNQNFNIGGNGCAFNYGPLLFGWAFFIVGILLSVVGAYYLGLSAARITSSETAGEITR